MKFRKKTLALIIVICAAAVLSVIALAVESGYDSTSDPLVAQSYLEARLEEQRQEYEAIIDSLEASLDNRLNDIIGSSDGNVYISTDASFETVTLAKGDVIYPKDGMLEIILRSGGAVAVVPSGLPAIANLTNGAEMTDQKMLVKNHLILIPANDGRGVKIVSSKGAEILIRGEYTVEHAN